MSIALVRNHFRLKNMKNVILLCGMRFLTFFCLAIMLSLSSTARCQERYRLVFWNVENLFDVWDDTTKNDDAFTPSGENHWTSQRYETKLSHICKTLVALGDSGKGRHSMPMLVGMAEVENDKVLRDLCNGTPLRRYRYGYIHFESPDQRGIDNALLYRQKEFSPFLAETVRVSDSVEGFFTRDILLVGGVTRQGDTLFAIIVHMPSKRGGTTSERRRMVVAGRLRETMEQVRQAYPGAAIVVAGDFNASPTEREIKVVLMHGLGGRFINLMEHMEPGRGSYKYLDHWSFIDQIIVSANMLEGESGLFLSGREAHLFDAPFLLLDDEKYLGKKVFRTYQGIKYQGGYSDHLPVYIDMEHRR